jgi:eukaryotic-like serine/threonine-protein kinase
VALGGDVILAGRLVLPPGVELMSVEALPAATRALFTHSATDFVLTRARARDPSRVVDASTAALLSCFRTPRTVADAVIEYSRTAGTDPESVLTDAWPLITRLVDDRLLVSEDDPADGSAEPRLAPGTRVDDWNIVRPVYTLDDTEVYQVRDDAGGWYALKASRCPPDSSFARWFDHEAAVLEQLDGAVGPRLRRRGTIGESPYLVLDWCTGSAVDIPAAECRALPAGQRRTALLELGIRVLDVYARLHERGVVHGDIHPRNILVDRDNRITLLDFALAIRIGAEDASVPRAGVPFYYEPELARALLDGVTPPPASEAGEQFALGALLYLLFTGDHYQDFQLDRDAFLSAICDGAMLSFATRGIEPWPEAEAALARALSKTPAGRYSSIAAFAASLRQILTVAPSGNGDGRPPAHENVHQHLQYTPDDAQRMLLGTFLTRAGYGHTGALPAMPHAPAASVMHGAAGLAYALYRLALVRGDPEMLALADLWASRAMAAGDAPDAFADVARGLTSAVHSASTPYHTIAGIHCVRALIANAAGDRQSLANSVDAFIAASPVPAHRVNLDLMLGHSGVLIASALLLEALAPIHEFPRQRLAQHATAALEEIENAIVSLPAMCDVPGFSAMGAAHGWTGVLYAALRWSAVTGRPASADMVPRLREIASYAQPWGRGLRWPHTLDPRVPEYRTLLAGWCNGSAGLVHLWTLAARLTGDTAFDDLADRAAWSTWEHASDAIANICCGLAGVAYALLVRYRATGDAAWYRRAATLASRAARVTAADPPPHPDSLYHGTVGVALLVADLDRPQTAGMPFFGSEGWDWGAPPVAQ